MIGLLAQSIDAHLPVIRPRSLTATQEMSRRPAHSPLANPPHSLCINRFARANEPKCNDAPDLPRRCGYLTSDLCKLEISCLRSAAKPEIKSLCSSPSAVSVTHPNFAQPHRTLARLTLSRRSPSALAQPKPPLPPLSTFSHVLSIPCLPRTGQSTRPESAVSSDSSHRKSKGKK